MPSPEPFEVLASEPDGSGEEGWRLLLRVPRENPLCEGHFPGHPIVPGVAHLAWVERALADRNVHLHGDRPPASTGPARITSIRGFRLRRPVLPGDDLELQLRLVGERSQEHPEDETPASVRNRGYAFVLRQGVEAVSDGRVEECTGPVPEVEAPGSFAPLGDRAPARTAVRETAPLAPSGSFPPVESLIPHRGSMQFLLRVLEAGLDSIRCEAAVPAGHPLSRDGRAPGWLTLEAAAQAAAALEALARREQNTGPRLGYLVGVREARIEAPVFPTGASFGVVLRPQGSVPPLAVYEARAEREGSPILTALLSTYIPPS